VTDPSNLRDALLTLAGALATVAGRPAVGQVIITVRDESGSEVVYHLPVEESTIVLAALSPLEAEIVRVLGTAALPAKAIAARLGRHNDSSLRLILANLCERRPAVIVKALEGYRVARPGGS
jgi:hypothetical protein